MYIVDVVHNKCKVFTAFAPNLRSAQNLAIDWSRHKHDWLGCKVRFGELAINVYDVSSPCAPDHVDVPMQFF